MSEKDEGKSKKKRVDWKPDEKISMIIRKGDDWKPDKKLGMKFQEGFRKKEEKKEEKTQ